MPSCQLGLYLQLLEEDSGGIATHLHVLHLLLVLFFNGGIPEHGLEFLYEVVPVRVSESGASRVTVVVDPELFSSMGPPTLGSFDEEGGGADHHDGRYPSELVAERLEVGVAVADEAVHVVVLSFEGLWQLHHDRPC